MVYILNELVGNSFMVFCNTCSNTQRIALLLRNLGFTAIPLHGQMGQSKRLGSLNKFKSKSRSILIATDVASRGLDIPHVDVVINFDIPTHSKDYIHRVGRTARAGRYGKSITFVSQYDVELYQRIEHLIGKKLPLFETHEEEVMLLNERVSEAQRFAKSVRLFFFLKSSLILIKLLFDRNSSKMTLRRERRQLMKTTTPKKRLESKTDYHKKEKTKEIQKIISNFCVFDH